MIVKKIGLLLAMSLVFVCTVGWSDNWNHVKESFEKIESVNARFIQEKHMKILAKPLVSKGVFYYKAPDSLRWEYQSPIQSVLRMHGNRVERHLKKGETYTKDSTANLKGMRIVLDEIRSWLKGSFTENPNFTAELLPGRSILLHPREPALAKIINRIELSLSGKPGIIESVAIYESRDSFTRLSFIEPGLNEKLSDSLFLELE